MAFSRGTQAGFRRRRPRGTLLLCGSLLAVALSCLHLLGTDFVAGFPSPQTARCGLHKVRSLQTSESSSQTLEGIEAEETRIFIRGYDFDTTEAAIREHFAKAGSIVKFKSGGKVKAQLSYSSAAEAKNAESLNGTTIEGSSRPVFVRPFKAKAKISAAIFVGGFATGTAEAALREHFGTAGSIVNFTFLGDRSALVTYSSDEEGKSAVASLQGKSMEGSDRWLDVRVEGDPKVARTIPAKAEVVEKIKKTKKVKERAEVSEKSTKVAVSAIFVGGFASGTAEAALREHFGTAGSVVDFKFLSNNSALVTYSSDEEGKSAVVSFQGKSMKGSNRWLDVRVKGDPKVAALPKENTVAIIGWDRGTTEAAITEHCGKAGSVVAFELFRQKSGALVTFSSSEEAATAVASLNGTTIEGNSRFISVRKDGGSGR
ncbi:unnamed protein product [Polarella glacialis]|uniref:RRM domain-containing protein n=1 Tax=Polarella glacialis TaxID=89957 RepID=A0A813H515_POLGL|nr:unnamed protein product [Polarella glacialis]